MDAKGIARALREQLKQVGHELTHSQVLELVAKTASLKDWNVLAARQDNSAEPDRPPTHCKYYCPSCGQQGTVSVVADAHVEQGPGNEDGYLFEGDADHYECSACGHQFLDWSSNWPYYQACAGYVLMVEPTMARWVARYFPVGRVLAVFEERGWDLEDIEVPAVSDAHTLVTVVNEMALREDANGPLIGRLDAYGVRGHSSAIGDTMNDAVKALLATLPDNITGQMLNQTIGIG